MHVSSGHAEQSSHSGPEGLRSRNSGHESCRPTPGSGMKLLICYIFFFHGQKIWTVNAWIHCKNTILLPPPPPNLLMLSGTTYFTLMLWIERWLGAGVRGNGSEKKNGRGNVQPYLSEIISSAMRAHFLKSGPAQWSGLLFLVPPLCFPPISAVKFYDIRTEQYNIYHTYLAALKSSSYSAFVRAKINLRTDSWNTTR